MKRSVSGFLGAVLMLLALVSPSARAAVGMEREPDTERVRTLIHVLDYLAADYPAAVHDGVVVNTMEFAEMVQFAVIADSLVQGLIADGTLDDAEPVLAWVRTLAADIDARADRDVVADGARRIRDRVVAASGIAVAPARWPEIAAGRRLYGTYCAACHGAEGLGDGPLAPTLDPAPAVLAEGERIEGIAPFQVFNTVRLGVEGTGMSGFPQLTEREVWDIAFFVKSMGASGAGGSSADIDRLREAVTLEQVASLSDPELATLLATHGFPDGSLAALRRADPPVVRANTLDLAERYLGEAVAAYREGRAADALRLSITAYLEGVEPVEPMLRAASVSLVAEVEQSMMAVRGTIQDRGSVEQLESRVKRANVSIGHARDALDGDEYSAWFTFGMALSILLREALEAFLIIITILGVIRASGQKRAARWVHAGWLAAVLVGLAGWFLVDALLRFSAAQREILEGGIALLAVVVLLSVGFWLHDKSSVRKWKSFIDRRVRVELGRGSLVGLAVFAFFAVFREAFESVLFLSALALEGGESTGTAIGAAAGVSFAAVLLLGMVAVRFSARLPVRQLFQVASWIIVALAVVLAGKGVHALQEAGRLPVSLTGVPVRFELLGVYPTVETIIAQALVIGTVALLWMLSRRSALKTVRA